MTEERFRLHLEELIAIGLGLSFTDDRKGRHSLSDFTLYQGDQVLSVNVKNAGTRFRKAKSIVGLDPDDCIPIPAYKALRALQNKLDLIYAVSVDYDLADRVSEFNIETFDEDEQITWDLLSIFGDKYVTEAEDRFLFGTVEKYWSELQAIAGQKSFHIISAKRSIAILNDLPGRTPGIGVRAWGTSAVGETNVHISIAKETVLWQKVADQIRGGGLSSVTASMNRTRVASIPDPLI